MEIQEIINHLIDIDNDIQIRTCFYDEINSKIYNKVEKENTIYIQYKDSKIDKLLINLTKNNIKTFLLKDYEFYSLFEIVETSIFLIVEKCVDSHILIPKCILKNFEENGNLYCCSKKNKKPRKVFSKTYNTKFGYYNVFYEKYLNKCYENSIGSIKKMDLSNMSQKEYCDLDNIIKRTKIMSEFRDFDLLQDIIENNYFSQIYSALEKESNMLIYERLSENKYSKFKTFIVLNKTITNFIIPSNIFETLNHLSYDNYFFPFNKKTAFLLLKENLDIEMPTNKDNTFIIDNDNYIIQINECIVSSALKKGKDVLGDYSELNKMFNINDDNP